MHAGVDLERGAVAGRLGPPAREKGAAALPSKLFAGMKPTFLSDPAIFNDPGG
jgi:hypothetical protein